MERKSLGFVVLTYGLPAQRPFAGFLLASRDEADRMAESAKTGPGEHHVVAEVFELGEDRPSVPPPGMEGLASLNAERTRQAGHRDADVARRALEILGDQCSQRTRMVAEARIESPGASWSEIAAKLGLNKDQATGLFRRLVHRVPVYYALRDDEAYAAYYR